MTMLKVLVFKIDLIGIGTINVSSQNPLLLTEQTKNTTDYTPKRFV